MKRIHGLLALILVLSMLPLATGSVKAVDADFDIPGGHFFTQANGQGGAGGTGFSITDEGNVPFWTQFQAIEGVSRVGYVSSRRFQYKGFASQATQKYVLQWQPGGGLFFLNVFDELSAAGTDDFLQTVRSIPRPGIFNEAGMSFDQITAARLALLDANPAIKAVYMASADPVRDHGLPTTQVTDVGPALVIRNQRDALQQWKVDMPFARAGEVTIVNGGDIFKEAGLIPGDAATPENAPGTTPATPAPTPVPPAPVSPYSPAGLSWEPNCGLVAIKVYIRDASGAFVNNVRVFVTSSGNWNTISVPTGQDGRDPGWTNVVLRQDPVDEPWKVWVLDDAGSQVSPAVDVVTDTRSCEPTGTGHQVATVVFVKGAAPQTPAPQPAAPQPASPQPPAPAGVPFVNAGITWEPNCGMTQVKVKVLDPLAQPLDGVLFHIESEDATWQATSRKTGSEGYDPGWTDFFLREEPVSGVWKVWAVSGNGDRLSDTVWLATDTGPCLPGQEGHQVATLQVQQVAPVVTPTPHYPYSEPAISWTASCTLTQLNIRVRDKAGNPVNGVKIHVATDGNGWNTDSLPTGGTDQGPGWTNIWLQGEPFALHLNLFVADKDGNPASPVVQIDTTNTDCSSGGHQVATIDFVKN